MTPNDLFKPGGVVYLPDQLTIRDHFAMAALTGLISQSWMGLTDDKNNILGDKIAWVSYKLADAMIAERNENKE